MSAWILRGTEDITTDQMGTLWRYIDNENGQTTNESGAGYGTGDTNINAHGHGAGYGGSPQQDRFHLWDGSGLGKGIPEGHPEK